MREQRFSASWNAGRIFALLGLLAAALVACRGGTPTNGMLPGIVAPSQYTAPAKVNPNLIHMTPFKKGPKLGTSAGQPVYALFVAKKLSLTNSLSSTTAPGSTTSPTVWVYGAPAIDGKAGPLAQIAEKTSRTSEQHLYVDARGRLFELTDRASDALMLVNAPVNKKGSMVVVSDLCQHDKQLGAITEVTKNSVTTWTVKRHHGTCPHHVTGAVAAPGSVPDSLNVSTPPTASQILFDTCMLGALYASAANALDHSAALLPALARIAALQTATGQRFSGGCSAHAIAITVPTAPPCPGPACTYEAPPVALSASLAACPAGTNTSVTFNAPEQTCKASVLYTVSSSSQFTAATSNASIVTVAPASGTVSGSGKLVLTLTAGSLGGTATVTLSLSGKMTTFDVTNAWSTSASQPIASLAFQLPTGTLPLGQTLSFTVIAKSADGQTIVGDYDHPIILSGRNLTISPTSASNSAAAQLTAAWNRSFTALSARLAPVSRSKAPAILRTPPPASGSITATADGHAATVIIRPATGIAYYAVGNTPVYDDGGFMITYGADGNIYYGTYGGPQTCVGSFCYFSYGAVGKFAPSTGAWSEVDMHSSIMGLLFTSDGALWVAGGASHNVYRFPPGLFNADSVQTIPVPSPAPGATYYPRELMSDGTNVWFDDMRGGRIFKNPIAGPYDGSALTAYPLPSGPPGTVQAPGFAGDGIQYGKDANIYVVDRLNGIVDQVNPGTGMTTAQIITPQETAYGLTQDGFPAPNFMTQDALGTLYLTYIGTNAANLTFGGVDSLVPGSSTINIVSLPSTPSGSEGYGVSANGSYLYYDDYFGGFGFVNTSTGESRLYRVLPITSSNFLLEPNSVVALPDGTAWFTCYGSGAPPLCLGHTVYLSGSWSLWPGPAFTINGFGGAFSQPVGVMEAPAQNSGPFTATSSNSNVCQLSSVVDHNFVITGLSQGTCTIVVTDASKHGAQLQVTVQPSTPPSSSGRTVIRRVPAWMF
jgi:hypothetical protein